MTVRITEKVQPLRSAVLDAAECTVRRTTLRRRCHRRRAAGSHLTRRWIRGRLAPSVGGGTPSVEVPQVAQVP